MTKFLLVVLGGAIGSSIRFIISEKMLTLNLGNFPYTIMLINIVGSLIMGLVVGAFAKYNFSYEVKIFITAGVLGGFTTFSAFSLDAVMLLEKGEYVSAAIYIFGSVFFSLFGFLVGYNLFRFV